VAEVKDGPLTERRWLLSCGHIRAFGDLQAYLYCPTCGTTKPVMRRAEAFEENRA
jgi:hypothetical protein